MYQDYNLIIHMYHSLARLLTWMSLLQVFLYDILKENISIFEHLKLFSILHILGHIVSYVISALHIP